MTTATGGPAANALAPEHLPFFITAPGSTDVLMVVGAIILVGAVLLVGVLFLHIHSLPERMAHRGHKLQFEIVAVMCLLALFTHNHLLWVLALLLAFIDIPDLLTPLNRMARASEKIAGLEPPSEPDRRAHEAEPQDALTKGAEAGHA